MGHSREGDVSKDMWWQVTGEWVKLIGIISDPKIYAFICTVYLLPPALFFFLFWLHGKGKQELSSSTKRIFLQICLGHFNHGGTKSLMAYYMIRSAHSFIVWTTSSNILIFGLIQFYWLISLHWPKKNIVK